jgi:hypothetical protein
MAGRGLSLRKKNSGAVTAAIERVAFSGQPAALNVGSHDDGTVKVAVTDSIAANNGSGFSISAAPASIVSLMLTRSVVVGAGTGLLVRGTNSTIRIAQSTVTGNKTGYEVRAAWGGAILSYGDNYIDDNERNVGALGRASKQ